DLAEHDLLERGEGALGIGTREIGALGDGVGELSLSEGHSSPESITSRRIETGLPDGTRVRDRSRGGGCTFLAVQETMRAYIQLEPGLRSGDVARARAAVGDPPGFPSVHEPYTNSPLLALALRWAPVEAVEELLELGADPNFEALDGFPALVGVILSE